MKLLDRYILRQIALPALLALAITSFLAVSNEIRDRAHDFAAFITITDTLVLMVLFLPLLVSIVIPMTFLMGLMLTFGRLAHQHEIVAMQTAGVSLRRIALPIIVTGALLSVLCFVIQDQVQPWAVGKAFDLIYKELPSRVTVDRLQPGVMHQYEGWRVYYAARDDATGALLDLDLVTPATNGAPPVYFHAQRAQLSPSGDGYELAMSNGHVVTEEHLMIEFDEQRLTLPPPSVLRPRNPRKMMPITGLVREEQEMVESAQANPGPRYDSALRKQRVEIAERISLPFAPLACAVAGAALGIRAERRGRSYMFAAAGVLALVYAILFVAVEPTDARPLTEFILRAWIPNVVLLSAGVVLYANADKVTG